MNKMAARQGGRWWYCKFVAHSRAYSEQEINMMPRDALPHLGILDIRITMAAYHLDGQ
jgi:hypothetical protein